MNPPETLDTTSLKPQGTFDSDLRKTRTFIQTKLKERLVGLNRTVQKIGDRIATVRGLNSVRAGELLYFPENKSYRIAFNLEKHAIGTILLRNRDALRERAKVEQTRRLAGIDVKRSVLGSVVNRSRETLLAAESPSPHFRANEAVRSRVFESPAPSIMSRSPVNKPLQTGILAVDTLIPIGRRQRELLIRDRQSGKTQVALDTILNLSNAYHFEKKTNPESKPVICVYVAIGQKASQVAEIQAKLGPKAMEQTVIVSASARDPASMQYLAPFTGTAIAEAFMVDQGYDTLIVFDDLSRHAQAYREMSLLLRRPPGREAYPRDIFYVHARLLERAANLEKPRSLTALPIVETLGRDISAYIPTNVISITDGQVFFSRDLFNQRYRPAVDVGLSVSRVRSAAQPKAISKLGRSLKLILAQYRELQIFTQFSSDIDAATQDQLDKGSALTNVFIQAPSQPYLEQVEFILLKAFSTNVKMKDSFFEDFNRLNEDPKRDLSKEMSILKSWAIGYKENPEKDLDEVFDAYSTAV